MLCEKCGKQEATFYYKETINGTSHSYKLCGACAAGLQKNVEDPLASFHKFFGLEDQFGSFLATPKAERSAQTTCPLCSGTLADFLNTGKAGCPKCYEVFEEALLPSIRRIHGRSGHTGGSPKRFREENEKKQQMLRLEKELKEAIGKEEYEKAAEIRDAIRALKQDELAGQIQKDEGKEA